MSCARIEESLDLAEGFHVDLINSLSMTTTDRAVVNWRDTGDQHLFSASPNFNLGSGVYTAPSAGLYLLSGNVRLNAANHGAANTWYRVTVTIDDYNGDGTSKWVDYQPSGDYHTAEIAGVYLLRRGQKVDIRVASLADTSFAVDGQSGFGILRLSDAIRRPSCMADLWGDRPRPAGNWVPVETWSARVNPSHG